MIKITNITIKNFLSFGNATQSISLDKNSMTLVMGSNTDANGETTKNGAGKSGLLQAISYALYGKPLTKIKLPNLVNNVNKKAMLVTIDFEKNGKNYRIERGQKPAVLKFFENNSEINMAQGENKHTQDEIERILGMTHLMFKHIVALNTFTEPFLKMSVGDQRDVIEELLGVTQISQRADTLKGMISETKDSIKEQEFSIKAIIEANSRIEKTIRTTQVDSDNWTKCHEAQVEKLVNEIEELQGLDYDAILKDFDALDEYIEKEKSLKSRLEESTRSKEYFERELKFTENQIKGFDETEKSLAVKIEDIQNRLDRYTSSCEEFEKELEILENEKIKKEKDKKSRDNTCSYCGQELPAEKLKEVQKNIQNDIDKISDKIKDIKGKLEKSKDEYEDLEKELASEIKNLDETVKENDLQRQSLGETITDAYENLKKFDSEIESIKSSSDLGKKPEPLFKTREEVYKMRQAFDVMVRDLEKEMEKENPYTSQLESLKQTLQEVNYDNLNEYTELLKHQDFLLKLLMSKDSFIRKKIIDQNLHYLNNRLNKYLEKLGLPHEVSFQSDLSVEITLLGRDFDFEQLSRGEMNRVIMATSWSFRDVWESTNDTINLVLVDEFLDQGTDGAGAESGLTVLKSMATERNKNVYLISHRDDLVGRIDNVIMVRKENDFSRFDMGENLHQ